MFSGRPSSGFTIIEVMIFLTISVIVFGSAVVTINNQNSRTAFAQSARDVELQLQDVFNDVETGYYPTSTGFSCTYNGDDPDIKEANPKAQGSNENCIFIGRAIQFGRNGAKDQVATATIVGKRLIDDQDVTNIQDAHPTLLEEFVGRKDVYRLSSDVEIDGLYLNHPTWGSFIKFSGVAVTSGLAEQSGGSLESGIVRTTLSPLGINLAGGQGIGSNDNNFLSYVEKLGTEPLSSGYIDGFILCLQEKGGGRKARITIGIDSQRLATSSVIDPSTGVCS
jgi:type II secretory pathway pseudopilin PulG